MKYVHRILGVAFVLVMVSVALASAAEDAKLYKQAYQSARGGRIDAAFMYYRAILRDFPSSKYASKATFAQGEYYFWMPEYGQGIVYINEFLQKYPGSEARLFALALLLKMAEERGNETLARDLRQQIIDFKNISLIFKKYDEYTYRSPLYREYKATYHIDKVEFMVDKKLFLTIVF